MSSSESNRWLLLVSDPGPATFNMAADEALLEAMPRLRCPVLRLYSWREPAASFGYFQKYAEVEQLTPLRPLVRRPTAGGIVAHDADWTYSLVFPAGHAWYQLRAAESYRRVHDWLRAAFTLAGVETRLAPEPLRNGPGRCFSGYEQFDLLWRGRKIAGAAQRRKQEGLLIQGSVQPDGLGLSRADWERALRQAIAEVNWRPFGADPELQARTLELERNKYALTSYNQRR